MPQHKSAKKRVRQTARRRLRNRVQRSRMRTMIKSLHETQDKEQAQLMLNQVKAFLDKLAGKNIIHPNKAANVKSKLEKQVNALA